MKKVDWSLILTLLGVIAAWIPFLYEKFSPNLIKGKLISQYDNVGQFRGEAKELFLFKLGIISLNQSFDLKDIDIDINFEQHGWVHSSSVNPRKTYFTLENKLKRLIVPEQSFLNNLTILKKDEPVVGYLMTNTPVYPNDKILEIKFIFKSFQRDKKVLSFKTAELDETKLFYDDSIWIPIDSINE